MLRIYDNFKNEQLLTRRLFELKNWGKAYRAEINRREETILNDEN
jgi:hypothetical protein